MGYTAYKLSERTQKAILSVLPPQYPDIRANHITVEFGVDENHALPMENPDIFILGHADDGNGIEALALVVNGQTHRPDGKPFHLTLSFDAGKSVPADLDPKGGTYKPLHSNALIELRPMDHLSLEGLEFEVTPEFIEHNAPAEPTQTPAQAPARKLAL